MDTSGDSQAAQTISASADALLEAGSALWQYVKDTNMDPDTTLRTQTKPLGDSLRKVQAALDKTSTVSPESLLRPGIPVPAELLRLQREARYLSLELGRLVATLSRLADEIANLKEEYVPLKNEIATLEALARILIGIQTISAEYREVLSGSEAIHEPDFASRRMGFVADQMKEASDVSLRFRTQVQFAFVKHKTKIEGQA